jgi:hypothetical protein
VTGKQDSPEAHSASPRQPWSTGLQRGLLQGQASHSSVPQYSPSRHSESERQPGTQARSQDSVQPHTLPSGQSESAWQAAVAGTQVPFSQPQLAQGRGAAHSSPGPQSSCDLQAPGRHLRSQSKSTPQIEPRGQSSFEAHSSAGRHSPTQGQSSQVGHSP